MEMYVLEERLDKIERMLKFIVDNTIASGIAEVIKTDENMTEECRDNLNETFEVLTDETGRFMGRYLDEYFEDEYEDDEDEYEEEPMTFDQAKAEAVKRLLKIKEEEEW